MIAFTHLQLTMYIQSWRWIKYIHYWKSSSTQGLMEEMWNITWNKLIDLSSRTWGENEGNRDLKWPIMSGASQVAQKVKKKKKKISLQCRRPRFDPWVRNIPWRREWQPTLVFLRKEFHWQRSLTGCSLSDHKESDMNEQLTHACYHIKQFW